MMTVSVAAAPILSRSLARADWLCTKVGGHQMLVLHLPNKLGELLLLMTLPYIQFDASDPAC